MKKAIIIVAAIVAAVGAAVAGYAVYRNQRSF